MSYALLALFGCLSGVTTLLFGFGGGFVVVPLLYRVLISQYPESDAMSGSAMHVAIATSTGVMIVSSWIGTRKQLRAGTLLWAYVWPLAGFIGLGAVIGAVVAQGVGNDGLRYAFVAYLGLTIIDCLLRRGFLAHHATDRPKVLGPQVIVSGGIGIGAIATMLGVGGSVMTVPLLRRSGLSMTQATAMANPLSLPVALVGSLTYWLSARWHAVDLGPGFVGYLDLTAFVILVSGALLGMRCATRWIGRMPDRVHAWVYIGLLLLVMLSMGVG